MSHTQNMDDLKGNAMSDRRYIEPLMMGMAWLTITALVLLAGWLYLHWEDERRSLDDYSPDQIERIAENQL